MLVSCVHLVAIRIAVFYSFSMLVLDALGDHMVEAYVASMVSLCLPHFLS